MRVLSIAFLFLFFISGCGGSGGDPAPATVPAINKAVMTFSTSLASGRTDTIGSVEFTCDLPAGVTVPFDSNGAISSNNLLLADKALAVSTPLVLGTYTAPSNGLPAKVHIAVIALNAAGNASGMLPGNFATLQCELTPGTSISAAAFVQPTNVVITDPAGVLIPDTEAGVGSVTSLIER